MRKLKAYVHIMAPVGAVKALAGDERRGEWLVTRGSVLLQSLSESWEATEMEGGTRFTLHMEYKARLSFLEPFMSDGMQQSVTHSLSRLKLMAEGPDSHLNA